MIHPSTTLSVSAALQRSFLINRKQLQPPLLTLEWVHYQIDLSINNLQTKKHVGSENNWATRKPGRGSPANRLLTRSGWENYIGLPLHIETWSWSWYSTGISLINQLKNICMCYFWCLCPCWMHHIMTMLSPHVLWNQFVD